MTNVHACDAGTCVPRQLTPPSTTTRMIQSFSSGINYKPLLVGHESVLSSAADRCTCCFAVSSVLKSCATQQIPCCTDGHSMLPPTTLLPSCHTIAICYLPSERMDSASTVHSGASPVHIWRQTHLRPTLQAPHPYVQCLQPKTRVQCCIRTLTYSSVRPPCNSATQCLAGTDALSS